MKKKTFHCIRASHIALFLMLYLTISLFTFGQSRTISLVFDDSGSMKNGKRFEAVNYALQVLVGLLNSDDRLFVVQMSSPDRSTQIDLHNKQKEIEKIRNWQYGDKTPFEAVDTAMKILETESKKNQDNWLIIFTDGEMEITPDDQKRVQQFFNSSDAKSIILNINIKQNELSTVFRNNGQVDIYQSPDNFEQITGFMEKIALSVMSMTQSGLNVNYNNNIVEINSVLPLHRLIVLEQDTSRRNRLLNITEVLNERSQKIDIAGSYHSVMTNLLYGKITHIKYSTSSNQVIPKGKIRISFNGTPEGVRMKFLPEVAARLSARPTKYENISGNIYSICEKEKEIEIEAEIKTFDGNHLPPDILSDTIIKVHYESHIETMNLKGNIFNKKIEITKDEIPISVSAKFPGYFNFRTNIFVIKKIYCKEPDVLGISQAIQYPALKVSELKNAPLKPIRPKINNQPVTKAKFKNLSLEAIKTPTLDFELQKTDDCWMVRPLAKWGLPCFTDTGQHDLVLELRSSENEIQPVRTTVRFTIRDASFFEKCGCLIIAFLLLLVLGWYILGLIKKPRFCRGSEIIFQRSTKFVKNKEISFPLRGNFINRYLLPYKPESAKVYGMKFKAGKRCSYIDLPRDAQRENMYISGNNIEDPRRRDQRLSIGEELMIEYSNHKESYKYIKS